MEPNGFAGPGAWLHGEAGLVYDPQFPATIIKWNDQSPNAHQAITGGQGHTLDPSALNGHDAVRCGGGQLQIDDHPSLQWGSGGHMIAAVVRTDPSLTGEALYWVKYGDGLVALSQTGQFLIKYMLGNEVVGVSIPADAPRWRLVIMRGPAMELRVDSYFSTGPAATANVDNVGWPVGICWGATSTHEIAEMIAVKGAVSDSDVANVKLYLEDKYGF